LTTFLKEMMRYGDGSEKEAVDRKKKLNIPAGRSVTLADFDDPDEEETENERSENEDVPDNQEFSNYDSNEEGFNMEKSDEARSEDLAECISEGDWVKVRFTYDKGVKVFYWEGFWNRRCRIYDSNEEGFNMEKSDEERSEDLAECISEGDWVK
ncbi:hypothetical protein J6590_107975, partial [Homalodisca vitripennis]